MAVHDIWLVVQHLATSSWTDSAGRTAILVLSLLFARKILIRIASKALNDIARVRTLDVQIRFAVIIVGIISIVAIWAPELRTLALSLTALAASLVVVGKELFLGIAGSFLRGVGGVFKVGDIVEIGGVRGEIIDHGFYASTLAELRANRIRPAPDARLITLPNSKIISETITVEASTGSIQRTEFTLPVIKDARNDLDKITAILADVWKHQQVDVEGQSAWLRQRIRNEVLAGEPEIYVDIGDGREKLHITFWSKSKDANRYRNEITLRYLEGR